MVRGSLLEFFDELSSAPGAFLSYDDGYRKKSYTYGDVSRAARAVAARLHADGIRAGHKVLIWGENRPEWIVGFWGCVLVGAIVVPVDYRASAEFVSRVWRIVDGRRLLVGDEVTRPDDTDGPTADVTWRLVDVTWPAEPVPLPPNLRDGITLDTTAEIIFTSGATAEPKGVVITHRNILANVEPVEREVRKYRRYGRPFFPLRFLNLLPLSHMFGQAMATFVPPMLPGEVVFIRGFNPADIVGQIRERRISVLVSVPKMLDVLADHLRLRFPHLREVDALLEAPEKPHWARRWWRYRDIHRTFGLKFWCCIVGAAPLDARLEAFWSYLGFLVVQGYGLTETAPIVTLNHPFHTRRGSVGRALGGVEIRLAPDGEILVRGENVSRGYYGADTERAQAFEGGWFHTGDIGEIDEAGELFIKGRKKEMIVTPEGLNVFPEDVERVLDALPGVRESAVVGVTQDGQERVFAVLVLADGVDPDRVVADANPRLADHQRLRGARVWPEPRLPRTEGTGKLKRRVLKAWAETGATPRRSPGPERSVREVLARYAGGRTLAPELPLDALGLSSLERIELMVALEEAFQTSLDEAAFSEARTVADLERLVARESDPGTVSSPPAAGPTGERTGTPSPSLRPRATDWEFPTWNTGVIARVVRNLSLATWLLPLTRLFAWVRVEGREHLAGVTGPVIFAANHQSHLDTPVILAALPSPFRYRLAPAMAKEFFRAHFFPDRHTRREWLTNSLNYYLSTLFFNAFPLPQREAGARQTLRYVGTLLGQGFSVLLFPEGRRSDEGHIGPFRPGVGMMAARLDVPIVPVRLIGVDRVLHQSWRMARPGRVTVRFGAPLRVPPHEGRASDGASDYADIAARVEAAVRAL